jgi:hypothetical protein
MTQSEFSGPACREIRHLLGVYIVGAIDPAERTLVDAHLGECASCRDELAGLAGLPAMLSRVPAADLARLSAAPGGLPEMAEPSAELLDALLRKVTLTRRARTGRSVAAVAAAAVIAAGSATAAWQLAAPAAAPAASEVASATSSQTGVAAVVDYSATPWHSTTMRVRVSGISPGTTCKFWVVGRDGRAYVGSWTVGNSYNQTWYPVSSSVPASAMHSFQITAGGKLLVSVPAS